MSLLFCLIKLYNFLRYSWRQIWVFFVNNLKQKVKVKTHKSFLNSIFCIKMKIWKQHVINFLQLKNLFWMYLHWTSGTLKAEYFKANDLLGPKSLNSYTPKWTLKNQIQIHAPKVNFEGFESSVSVLFSNL